jgi:hypothetical protein
LTDNRDNQGRRVRLGNPDFFLIVYVAIWVVDLAMARFNSGSLGLLLGTPIAMVGMVVSLCRWRQLSLAQRACSCALLGVALYATGPVLYWLM